MVGWSKSPDIPARRCNMTISTSNPPIVLLESNLYCKFCWEGVRLSACSIGSHSRLSYSRRSASSWQALHDHFDLTSNRLPLHVRSRLQPLRPHRLSVVFRSDWSAALQNRPLSVHLRWLRYWFQAFDHPHCSKPAAVSPVSTPWLSYTHAILTATVDLTRVRHDDTLPTEFNSQLIRYYTMFV